MTDPFHDVRDQRMGDLNPEQQYRARELWLREQMHSLSGYYREHIETLMRVIDGLRGSALAGSQAPGATTGAVKVRMYQYCAKHGEEIVMSPYKAADDGSLWLVIRHSGGSTNVPITLERDVILWHQLRAIAMAAATPGADQ